ncbi:MAG: bifunctional DNA-formamidopyrimidine glycosylase/DNA-(apurinic or apyrimidinic site) lyase [Phycisphaerales bacterium]
MPELPEVESVRRSLLPIVGSRVERATVRTRRSLVVAGDPPGGFSRARSEIKPRPVRRGTLLDGAAIQRLDRHGKQLAIVADDGRSALIHLGMTGRVEIRDSATARTHDHVVWALSDGRRVVFNDARRFGGVWALPDAAALRARWEALGPDALTIDAADLRDRLKRSARPVKAALLDQTVLAGVGNIYADESLHAARVHPARLASSLRADAVDRLAGSIRAILRAAVDAGGSTLRDGTYSDASGAAGSYATRHAAYGRAGEPCRRCGAGLVSDVIAQRTSVWCPRCQRAPPAGLISPLF